MIYCFIGRDRIIVAMRRGITVFFVVKPIIFTTRIVRAEVVCVGFFKGFAGLIGVDE